MLLFIIGVALILFAYVRASAPLKSGVKTWWGALTAEDKGVVIAAVFGLAVIIASIFS